MLIKPSTNKTDQKQDIFMKSLTGIGDILVFETRRKSKNKLVEEGLGRIKGILEELFRIREENPEQFDRLILDPEFLNRFQKDEEEASMRLMFFPERQLVSFTITLNQIRRVHETAITAHNEEISRQATYHLIWILEHLTTLPENGVFVEQLLRSLYEMSDLAIRNEDRSMYSGTCRWYFSAVFRDEFRLEYLNVLTKRFRIIVQEIISNNQWDLYKSMVQSLVDRVRVGIDKTPRLWYFEHRWIEPQTFSQLDEEFSIRKKNDELMKTAGAVSSVEEYENWLKSFEAVAASLAPYVPDEHVEDKDKILRELRSYISSRLKFNNLQQTVFVLGAFALFEERPQFIRYLWEYKQPHDADGVHVGEDIIPKTLEDIAEFYFRKGYFEWDVFPWKDHHGSRQYTQRYFLLHLARQLEPVVEVDGRYPKLEAFALPQLSIAQLNNIESVTDDLIAQAKILATDVELLKALRFSESRVHGTFDQKLPVFLSILKKKATAQIEEVGRTRGIDAEKIAEFNKDVVDGFRQSSTWRKILEHCNLYDDRTNSPLPLNPPVPYGINQIDDKAAFFQHWHVAYLRWGENYGEGLAADENTAILEKILGAAVRREERLEQVLDKKADLSHFLLIASPMTIFEALACREDFVSRWRPDAEPLKIESFQGWFLFGGVRIPVFALHVEAGTIMVVNHARLGRLVQFDPRSVEEQEDSRTDILSISVRSFSEDDALRTEFLDKPPAWLTEKGDRETQERYLQSRVLVRVLERYEFALVDEPDIQLLPVSVSFNR